MKKEFSLALEHIEIINPNNSLMTFVCPEIVQTAIPGQFVNMSASKFLKRPFGICSTNMHDGSFQIGVRRVGEGTDYILSAKPGEVFDFLGPLGNGFALDECKKLILVGGGTGVFPLIYALEKANSLNIPTIQISGFRCKDDACFTENRMLGADQTIICTDKGDLGMKGTVMKPLSSLSENEIAGATVFTVGPEIMMNAVSQWAATKGLDCFVSLEKRMACGVGLCLVCTCKTKSEDTNIEFEHKRCCMDGPVFRASEVIW
jgi:dihydroorotate dehydrogenase electron transfer subunit